MSKPRVGADPVMAKVAELLIDSGKTRIEVGLAMGYKRNIARQSVWKLLRCKNPRIATLRKFVNAIGVSLISLLDEEEDSAIRDSTVEPTG